MATDEAVACSAVVEFGGYDSYPLVQVRCARTRDFHPNHSAPSGSSTGTPIAWAGKFEA